MLQFFVSCHTVSLGRIIDTSPTGQIAFAYCLVILPTGLFTY